MTNTTTAASSTGKRVKITLTGHRYNAQKATVISETKNNYKVAVDGVKTPQTIAKAGIVGVRGRRPKSN